MGIVVEVRGIEPLAPCVQSRCSPAELHPHETTGRRRGRYPDYSRPKVRRMPVSPNAWATNGPSAFGESIAGLYQVLQGPCVAAICCRSNRYSSMTGFASSLSHIPAATSPSGPGCVTFIDCHFQVLAHPYVINRNEPQLSETAQDSLPLGVVDRRFEGDVYLRQVHLLATRLREQSSCPCAKTNQCRAPAPGAGTAAPVCRFVAFAQVSS